MRRWVLAVAMIFSLAVSVLHADYVVITVNLAYTTEAANPLQPTQNRSGAPGTGAPGMQGQGMFGQGMQGQQQLGMQGQLGGALRGGQGGGRGGFRGGFGGGGGFAPVPPGGGAQGFGGGLQPPGGGIGGGPNPFQQQQQQQNQQQLQQQQQQQQNQNQQNQKQMLQGGGMGMAGGMNLPGQGNSLINQQTGPPEDSDPLIVQIVVEAKHADIKYNSATSRYTIHHKYGQTTTPYDTREVKVKPYPIQTIPEQYTAKYRKIKPENAERAQGLFELAEWSLAHGLPDKTESCMKELAAADPKHRAVVAYEKIKAAMDRPLTREDASFRWAEKLDYKIKRSKHYTLLYDCSDAEADRRLARLEQHYQGFFTWFALRGDVLPTPDYRLIAILVNNKSDKFKLQHDAIFDDALVFYDGYYAHRENMAVFSAEPVDESFQTLQTIFNQVLHEGNWTPEELLQGKKKGRVSADALARAQTYALLDKVKREESELASVGHQGSRQLIAAIGFLPRNVEAPKWIDFGMASFFETPKGSWWAGMGANSMVYRVAWDNMGDKKDKATDALTKVITDQYFLEAQKSKNESDFKKARTMTWALTYYLANEKREGLIRYYQEIAKLPREMDFDAKVLQGCFARAFNMASAAEPNELDPTKVLNLASAWYEYIELQKLEAAALSGQSNRRGGADQGLAPARGRRGGR